MKQQGLRSCFASLRLTNQSECAVSASTRFRRPGPPGLFFFSQHRRSPRSVAVSPTTATTTFDTSRWPVPTGRSAPRRSIRPNKARTRGGLFRFARKVSVLYGQTGRRDLVSAARTFAAQPQARLLFHATRGCGPSTLNARLCCLSTRGRTGGTRGPAA